MKKKKTGLDISLLSRVRKEITVVKTTLFNVGVYRIEGKTVPTIYATEMETAKLFARKARIELAKTLAKRESKKTKL